MGKNGGEPTDTILTLEEALMRFKRKRSERWRRRQGRTARGFQRSLRWSFRRRSSLQGKVTAARPANSPAIEVIASVSVQHDEASAEMSASEDFVAVIDGIPRTLDQLEQLADG